MAAEFPEDRPHLDALVVVNPVAGASRPEAIRSALDRELGQHGFRLQIHETAATDRPSELVREAVEQGCQLFVAAGGDGTVAQVAAGLVISGLPMGIIPVGTGNVMARDLGIPTNLQAALELIRAAPARRALDAMRIGDRHFFLEVGVGPTGAMMRDTSQAEKRRFRRLAYVPTGLKALLGLQPQHFRLAVDGVTNLVRASAVELVNFGTAGDPAIRWGREVRPDDGTLDVCVVRARTALDLLAIAGYLLLGRGRSAAHVRFLRCRDEIRIGAERPLPVQGDGDFLGYTPVSVQVVRGAVQVIVPSSSARPA